MAHPGLLLLDAAERDDAAQVAALLAEGALDSCADPAAEVGLAFRKAAELGRAEVVRLLLADPRVDPAALDEPRFAGFRARPLVAEALARRR